MDEKRLYCKFLTYSFPTKSYLTHFQVQRLYLVLGTMRQETFIEVDNYDACGITVTIKAKCYNDICCGF